MNLEHGERFGKLTVLGRFGRLYRVGCVCGNSKDRYSAKALMRAGGHTKCSRCRKQSACKDRSDK